MPVKTDLGFVPMTSQSEHDAALAILARNSSTTTAGNPPFDISRYFRHRQTSLPSTLVALCPALHKLLAHLRCFLLQLLKYIHVELETVLCLIN